MASDFLLPTKTPKIVMIHSIYNSLVSSNRMLVPQDKKKYIEINTSQELLLVDSKISYRKWINKSALLTKFLSKRLGGSLSVLLSYHEGQSWPFQSQPIHAMISRKYIYSLEFNGVSFLYKLVESRYLKVYVVFFIPHKKIYCSK